MNRILPTKKDFSWIGWTAKEIQKESHRVLSLYIKALADIKKIPSHLRTFENTIIALESSGNELSDFTDILSLIVYVHPNTKTRDAAQKETDRLNKKITDLVYDEKVYKTVREYTDSPQFKKRKKLSTAEAILLRDMLTGYKRIGFGFSRATRMKIKKLSVKIDLLSTKFLRNVTEYKDHIFVKEEDLEGLSSRYKQGLFFDPKRREYKVTLAYPDLHPFLAKAKNAQKRKELMDKSLRKGGQKNITLLKEILLLKQKKARLLGYRTYADYAIEVRMAKKTKKVEDFVHSLEKKLRKSTHKDISLLRQEKIRMTGDKSAVMNYFDLAYYADQLQNRLYGFDTEKLREYFPIDAVKKGTFSIYEKLFGVRFVRVNSFPVWYKDVETYAVKKDGKVISYFFLDLYPREGKYGHACAAKLKGARMDTKSGKYIAPMVVMVANFSKPTKSTPSLLSHGEVETFFHEFGHVMHVCLTEAEFISQSGYNVAWDFAEAPSQMLEYWVWNKKTLPLLSSHFKTGKRIPDVLLKKLLNAQHFLEGYGTMRQIVFTLFDMELHTKNVKNIPKTFGKMLQKYTGITYPKNHIWPAGFTHIVGGYDAGYYGYLWARVFAADMFTRFSRGGVLNSKIGEEYRDTILALGSSVDEMDLVKRFLGRKPSITPFLKEIGAEKKR